MDKKQGFTLIELLIVVTVIAIIASMGYPYYSKYVERAERKRVVADMLEVASRLERIKSQQFRYPAAAPVDGWDNDQNRYDIDVVVAADGSTFVITADPSSNSSQASDHCGTMTLSNIGEWTFAGTYTEDDCL